MEEPSHAKVETENEVHGEAKSSSESGKVEYFPKYKALLNQVKDHLGPNAYKTLFNMTEEEIDAARENLYGSSRPPVEERLGSYPGIKKCGRCGAHDHENCITKKTTSSDGIPIETTVIQEPNSPKPVCNHGKQNNMKGMKKVKKPKLKQTKKVIMPVPKKKVAPHMHKEIQNFKEQARKAKDLGEHESFLNEGLSEMQKARERIEYYKRNGYTSGPVPQDVVDQASRAIEQMTAAMDEKIKSYEDCREKWATSGNNNNQMSLKEKEKAVAADKIRLDKVKRQLYGSNSPKSPCPHFESLSEPDCYNIPRQPVYPVYFPVCTATQTDYTNRTFAIKVRLMIRQRYHILTFMYMADFDEKKMKIKVIVTREGEDVGVIKLPGFEDYAHTPRPRKTVNQGVKKGLHSHVDILMKPYTFGKEDPAVLDPSLIVPDVETEEEQTEEYSNEEENEQIEQVAVQNRQGAFTTKKNKNSSKTKKNKKKGGKNNSPRTF